MNLKKPTLIVIAGPNGSGKTSITHKILKHEWVENCIYINPDEIARDKFGDWNSREAILNAAKHAEEIRENCIKNKQSLIFETVLSATDKLTFIQNELQFKTGLLDFSQKVGIDNDHVPANIITTEEYNELYDKNFLVSKPNKSEKGDTNTHTTYVD